MTTLIFLIIIAAFVWYFWNVATKGKQHLVLVELSLDELEKNQSMNIAYKNFMASFDKATWLQEEDFFKLGGIYDRLLAIFKNNYSNQVIYEILRKVFRRFSSISVSKKQRVHNGLIDTIEAILKRNPVDYTDNIIAFLQDSQIFLAMEIPAQIRLSSMLTTGVINILESNPINLAAHENLFQTLNHCSVFKADDSQQIYNSTLNILDSNQDNPIVKQLVLTIGRWHFGNSRPEKRPTVYDEQAIQNDIFVRSSK